MKIESEYVDDRSKSIVIDRTKCLLCGRCQAACTKKTGTGSIKIVNVNGKRIVTAEDQKCFDDTNCLLCGQCVAACPVAALSEKSHIERVKEALEDPEKHVIVAMAPCSKNCNGRII